MSRAELQRTGRALAHPCERRPLWKIEDWFVEPGVSLPFRRGWYHATPASARLAAKISDRYEGRQINSWVKSG